MVLLLVVKPPELAFAHDNLLVPGNKLGAHRGVNHQVITVADGAVFAYINMRGDFSAATQARYPYMANGAIQSPGGFQNEIPCVR